MSYSDFIHEITWRGYLHQCTALNELDALAKKKAITGYIGFDATADSLHVGSMVQIMILRRLQQTGHRPIVLMGGGTTKIGDPSGKDAARRMLTPQDINQNISGIQEIFTNFLEFGEGKAIMANNADWLDKLNYIEFLRDYGRHFSVNRMLSFDSVKLRLEREQNLSFLEFNYMILQAYDFVELAKRYQCQLQMGGSDQWGNIVNGVELGRRTNNMDLFGLTTPLIATASGAKMGKTAQGAVWLNKDRLSPYDYWQYWRNTEDADVVRFLKMFTDLPQAEIERLAKLQGAEINQAKITLANECTKMAHGNEAATSAEATARAIFIEGQLGEDLPRMAIAKEELSNGIPAYEMLKRAGLVASNAEGRRLINGGGAKLNDKVIEDENYRIGNKDFDNDGSMKLSFGKKKHVLVNVNN